MDRLERKPTRAYMGTDSCTVALDRIAGLGSVGLCGPGRQAGRLTWAEDVQYLHARQPEDADGLRTAAGENLDQALIRGSLARDESSFARLVERYEAAVAGVLWHFTRDRLVLEELVQDTFVEAYFSLRRFRENAPFLPWLRTIATRVGYRSWRRRRRDRGREARLREWRRDGHPGPASRKPSDTADYVYRVLELLDPKDRLVLTLQYFEDCTASEIAARTGWSVSLVKVRAFRARKKLRALLLEAEHTGHERP